MTAGEYIVFRSGLGGVSALTHLTNIGTDIVLADTLTLDVEKLDIIADVESSTIIADVVSDVITIDIKE